MTEFEMAYLYNDMLLGLGSAASYFFAMLTAFLVASYLAAHRLTRAMAVIVVSIFVAACWGSIIIMYRQMESLGGLAGEMRNFANAARGLQWHAVAQIQEFSLYLSRYIGTGLFVATTAASVYFFFHSRRTNRKMEPGHDAAAGVVAPREGQGQDVPIRGA
jgi:cellobiose-specific phosphotransferase system component IIC